MRSRKANLPLPLQSPVPSEGLAARAGSEAVGVTCSSAQGEAHSAACSGANPVGHEAGQYREAGFILIQSPLAGLKSLVVSVTSAKPLQLAETVPMDSQRQLWQCKVNGLLRNSSSEFLLVQVLGRQHWVRPKLVDVLKDEGLSLALSSLHSPRFGVYRCPVLTCLGKPPGQT